MYHVRCVQRSGGCNGSSAHSLSAANAAARDGWKRSRSVLANVILHDKNGNPLQTLRVPMQGMAKHGTSLDGDDLAKDPLKPNDSRFFPIAVSQVPANWSHNLPDVQIADVTSE